MRDVRKSLKNASIYIERHPSGGGADRILDIQVSPAVWICKQQTRALMSSQVKYRFTVIRSYEKCHELGHLAERGEGRQ